MSDMFSPEISQSQGINTAVEPSKKTDTRGPLVQQLSQLLSVMPSKKKTAEQYDNAVYQKAAITRTEMEGEFIAGLDETERAMTSHPELFADNTLTKDEEDILRQAKYNVDAIRMINNPAQRQARMNLMGKEFLKSFSPETKPEVFDKVRAMYNIKTADEPLREKYGQAVYDEAHKLYTNPTPVHFITVARRNRDIAAVEDINRAIDLKFKKGEVAASDIQVAYGNLVDSNAQQDLLILQEEFARIGAITDDKLAWFAARRAADADAVKSQIGASLQSAYDTGAQVKDPQSLYKSVDDMTKPWQDIVAKFGTDPSMPKRMDQLYQAITQVPELAAGANVTKLAQLAAANDIPLRTMLGILTQGREQAMKQLKSLGVTTLTEDDLVRSAAILSDTMLRLMDVDPDKLPDPGLARLAEYLSAKWAGSKSNTGDPVPEKVVKIALDGVDKGSVPEVWRYLASTPALVDNVQQAGGHERLISQVRNNLIKLTDEVGGKYVTKDTKGRYVVYAARPGSTARGEFSGLDKGTIDVALTQAVNDAKGFLGTSKAQKLLGGDAELQKLMNVIEPGGSPVNSSKGATFDDMRAATGDLSGKSPAELADMRKRLERSAYDAAPGSAQATQVKKALDNLDAAQGVKKAPAPVAAPAAAPAEKQAEPAAPLDEIPPADKRPDGMLIEIDGKGDFKWNAATQKWVKQ